MPGNATHWRAVATAIAVVGGGFLAADTTNAVIAYSLRAPPGAALSGTRTVPEAGSRTRALEHYLSPILRRNVFLHGEPVPGEEAPAAATDVTEEAGCTLPLQVLASVVVPANPALSLVTILDVATKRIRVLQVGERALDVATLVEVREPFDEAVLRKDSVAVFARDDGSRVLCSSSDAAPPAPAVARGGTGIPSAPTGEGIRKLSSNQYEIPRAEIDAVMNGGLATIATTVRIVPYFEAGKSAGFKLYSIKPGSILSKLGLLNGDILRKVNGYDINSPEKALEVYSILKNERNVTLDVTRSGKPQTFDYAIR